MFQDGPRILRAGVFFIVYLTLVALSGVGALPQNYEFFNLDRGGLHRESFWGSKVFVGAQVKYPWPTLEPVRDQYDFRSIDEDLAFLGAHGKKLFLQIQDVSFSESLKNVPGYLLTDPSLHGGADRQYDFADDRDRGAKPSGWVARRWDPAVSDRFRRLLTALGKRYDGKVEGITLPETAVDFGETGKYFPEGFTPAGYRDSVLATMAAAKGAFPRSVVLQYANFMPGEWLPWDDKGYLGSVFAFAKDHRIAVGGPDLLPGKKAQLAHSYHFAELYKHSVVLGYAVQEGNYRQAPVDELWSFARKLNLTYVFWFPEEPYFTRDVVPFLRRAVTGA